MSAIVRQATDSDLSTLAEMYEAFLDESLATAPGVKRNPELDVTLALTQLMMRERSVMLVAEADGKVAGFAHVEVRRGTAPPEGWWQRLRDAISRRRAFTPLIVPPRGWLAHLYVSPDFRRKGIASSLIRAAAARAKAHGAASLELNVLADNAAARALYEKLGMSATLVEYRLKL